MGDVVPAPWGGYLVLTHEACDEVFRGTAFAEIDESFRDRQDVTRWTAPASHLLDGTLGSLNSPEHARQRRAIGSLFDRRTLEALHAPVEGLTDRLLDRFADDLRAGEADFAQRVSEEMAIGVIGRWLHLPEADHPLMRELTHAMAFILELLPTKRQIETANAAVPVLRDYFVGLVRERRRSPGDDPISHWARVWDAFEPDREAADRTLFRLAMFLMLTAVETSSTLLSATVARIAGTPGAWQTLREHPDRVPAAVDEVVRYESPVQVVTRVATDDTRLGDVLVPRDNLIHLMLGSANHDPARYTDPDVFDIARTGTHLGFGGGVHYCVGAMLARWEAVTLLGAMLRRFPTLRMVGEPAWAPRVALRRITAMKVAAS